MPGIDGLRAALEVLPLRIEDASVVFSQVALASYADGPRPTSAVSLNGGGLTGRGEHVGWTESVHREFGAAVASLPSGSCLLGEWVTRLTGLPAYDRAALEAAAIDLALLQAGTNLFRLAGVLPRPVRYVVSFARTADPVAEVHALGGSDLEWKIDADPAWSDATLGALAQLGCVRVIDFKMDGDVADHERAARHLPDAWIEDPKPGAAPWSPAVVRRLSADAAAAGVAALNALVPCPAAVNLKPARMGSVLEAIACAAHAESIGLTTYIGGMFEVGVGRGQLLTLAALACPDGPNDIAPLGGEGQRPKRLVVHPNQAGFASGQAGLASEQHEFATEQRRVVSEQPQFASEEPSLAEGFAEVPPR